MILASASLLTLSLALAAAVGYAIAAAGTSRLHPAVINTAVWIAWFLHGILLVMGLTGTEARFGFAPALSLTAWLVGLVYAVEGYVYPHFRKPWLTSGLGSACVLLALLFPGATLNPNASSWLPLHFALGISSYGLFAVAVAHAWLMTRAEARVRNASDAQTGMPILTMERLTFRFVMVGFMLLSATLLAGLLFGSQLYGGAHALQWNHKTIFAFLSWLTFAVLMVGRARFGWRGRQALRVLYIGSGLLLLAYVGSRFVMEVVLGKTL
ncbi:MAG: cytochrome c biogenesis protein CcsA [Rhodoferax sp.]|nr:cytochrome c biogenesis protein CcsA [Rhodoferax sp.]